MSRKPALTAAAFFLTLAVSAPVAAAKLAALADDAAKLTTAGRTVGDGYVAPGFVIDGPPVSAAPVAAPAPKQHAAPAPQEAAVPASGDVAGSAPAEKAATPVETVRIERVGKLETTALPEPVKPAETLVAAAAPVAAPSDEASAPAGPAGAKEIRVAQAVQPAAGQLAQLLAQASDASANDPLEPVNRVIFEVNHFLERLLLRPVSEMYVLFLPQEARDGIRNFLRNVRTPIVLANDILQGEGERAWQTTQRFFINSTLGVGGLIDAADRMGIKHHDEDLGQTFAVWGAGEMLYIVLPLLGPSNPRDAVGGFLDRYFDPVWYWTENTDREEIGLARTVVSGVDSYSRVMDELRKLEETSIDYYAAIRSIYRQKREAEIRNGQPKDVPLPDIRYDFNADVNIN